MPIKLIKVTRDLNVGITTVVEFLHKKGHLVESNPNTKISDEQYELLISEFGKPSNVGGRRERPAFERPVKKVHITKKETPEIIKTEVPKEFIPQIVTKGKIDLDEVNKRHEPQVQAEAKAEVKKDVESVNKQTQTEPAAEKAVVAEKPKEVQKEEQQKPAEKLNEVKKKTVKAEIVKEANPESTSSPVVAEDKSENAVVEETTASGGEDSLFRLNTPKLEPNIKVRGKIDLTALNQSTRPKKKTKEERKKEREDKRDKLHPKGQGTAGTQGGAKDGAAASKDGESKKKRKRIKKDRVDVNNTPGTNAPHAGRGNKDFRKPRLKKPVKAEVSDEDVQKQVKETLARLTNRGNKSNRSAKYRRDKRDAAVRRETELLEQEERESKVLKLTEFVTANDLANMMDIPVTQVIATCMSIGIMVSINQRLDAETINIVADEFDFKTEYVSAEVIEAINADEEEDTEEELEARPPIVTVMGHVDHGKTSLLDGIRNANVIAGEAGGITQHIGAYNVKLPRSGRRITFLDTPGHEAFTAMRARGAKITDIAIIIVAADDNVMPQTIEAINHAAAAGVPIVFAINKIDKPHANPEKIKEELANMNYLVEDWGGKYQSQEISAKKGTGVEELLEKVLLEADLLDLKANPNRRAVGSIVESSLDKGRGYVSTVLVETGTLKTGDIVLAGTQFGRVKAMFNERNQRIEEAGPSEPALILGLDGAPQSGDAFNVLETEQEARDIATRREQLQRELNLRTQKMLTLDDIGRRIAIGNFQELNVIVKGDVDGSVEALSDSLIGLSTPEIQVNVIHKAVGQISESDVVLAAASNAIVVGFQVRPSLAAKRQAENEGVEIRLYSIIYDTIEDVKSAMEGMLEPEVKEEITANVEVREVFKITKVGTVAGCMVKEGKIKRSHKIRLIRDGIVIYTGELGSLKRYKDDVKEVAFGYECGLNITNYNDIKVGDMIEAFEQVEIKKTL